MHVSHVLREELDLRIDQEFFWTDSQIVLGYIKNEARRIHIFVPNRVQKIRDTTDPKQWFYVETIRIQQTVHLGVSGWQT